MDSGRDSQATQLEPTPMTNESMNFIDASMSTLDSTFPRYVYACAMTIFPSSPTHAAYVRFSVLGARTLSYGMVIDSDWVPNMHQA